MAIRWSAIGWDPWRALEELEGQVSRAFRAVRAPRHYPPFNVYEDEEGLTVIAELSGVTGVELEVTAKGDSLTIKGARERPEEEGREYHRRERRFGEFERSITLPAGLDTGKVEAGVRNGLLVVRLPKAEEAKPRKIEIKGS